MTERWGLNIKMHLLDYFAIKLNLFSVNAALLNFWGCFAKINKKLKSLNRHLMKTMVDLNFPARDLKLTWTSAGTWYSSIIVALHHQQSNAAKKIKQQVGTYLILLCLFLQLFDGKILYKFQYGCLFYSQLQYSIKILNANLNITKNTKWPLQLNEITICNM